jgi:hypothetical protein
MRARTHDELAEGIAEMMTMMTKVEAPTPTNVAYQT